MKSIELLTLLSAVLCAFITLTIVLVKLVFFYKWSRSNPTGDMAFLSDAVQIFILTGSTGGTMLSLDINATGPSPEHVDHFFAVELDEPNFIGI